MLIPIVDVSGKQDFLDDRLQVVFPPSTSTGEDVMLMNISFINDSTNEAQEGFFILASIDTIQSDPMDVQNAMAIRNGVALIRIDDDDRKLITVYDCMV